ncbi:oxidoreductase-like domain-containing protein [Alteromonas lipolytica]|uniref:oxidoreductase-like domain-containing protein n=1 Tax=Alteromonas lipolytica TaxID=1856405 RepID=UPI0009F56770|nr:oxidoreductase-like domain-containing protein [Alteromonas lipolytica]GGF80015.1 hypothetical protein GCM10011338_35460 [Alteromonas lipolytica]
MHDLPPEPEKPLYSDCCGGGSCCPCVWDDYYEKLAIWREAKQAQAAKTAKNEEKAE